MAADAALQSLFEDVCRTLTAAGFDVAVADTGERTGLRIRREAGAVVVSWKAGEESQAPGTRGHDGQGELFAEYRGIRKALREALLAVLVQAGYAAFSDRDTEVRVALR